MNMLNAKTFAVLAFVLLTPSLCLAQRVENSSEPQSPPATVQIPDISPGEKLLKEFEGAASFTLGNKTAPLLYAAILPNAPETKAFWQAIQPAVKKGSLRVRLIPAGIEYTKDERDAEYLLKSADVAKTWDAFMEDTKSLHGKPDEAMLKNVRANTALIDRWRLPTAPYLLYRSKDGQVKVVQGAPSDMQAILDDMPVAKKGDKK